MSTVWQENNGMRAQREVREVEKMHEMEECKDRKQSERICINVCRQSAEEKNCFQPFLSLLLCNLFPFHWFVPFCAALFGSCRFARVLSYVHVCCVFGIRSCVFFCFVFFALCFVFFVFSWCFMHVCFFSVCMYWILMRCLSHIYIEVSDTVSWQILSVTHSKLFRRPAWDEYLRHNHVPGHVHKLAVTGRNSVCLLVITLPWVKIKGFSDRRVAHPLAGRRRETQRFMGEEL